LLHGIFLFVLPGAKYLRGILSVNLYSLDRFWCCLTRSFLAFIQY